MTASACERSTLPVACTVSSLVPADHLRSVRVEESQKLAQSAWIGPSFGVLLLGRPAMHTHKQSFLFGRSLTSPAFHLACPLLPPLVSLPNHMAFGNDTARGAARCAAASPLPPNSTCREAHQPVVTHCPLRAPTQAYSPTISSTYCAKPYR